MREPYPWWALSTGVSVPSGSLTDWPRRGASLYGIPGDRGWPWRPFLRIVNGCGLNYTGVWTMGGWPQKHDLMYAGLAAPAAIDGSARMPFLPPRADGKFDLYAPNPEYFDFAEEFTETANSLGIVVGWTILDLYTWSWRKAWLPGIGDAAATGPFRNNINGIVWGGNSTALDDLALTTLPSGPLPIGTWLAEFIEQLAGRLKRFGPGKVYIPVNEGPEKDLHFRIRNVIKRVDPDARILCTRNDDSPGQYANMGVGHPGGFDGISLHGWKNVERLREVWPKEAGTGRPETYEALLASLSRADCGRIQACSDGARLQGPIGQSNYPFDLPKLREAFAVAWAAGCGIDHMSGGKMVLFNEGRHDLSFVETDFLTQLARL